MRNQVKDRQVSLPGAIGRAAVSLVGLVLVGCAHVSLSTPAISDLPELQLPDRALSPEQAVADVATPELLELSDEMRGFVDRYVRHGNERQRMITLHRSLRSPALVDISYDPGADGTAAAVFDSGAANCLSYAHMFVSLARYAGLNAHYQSLELRPEWSRHGDQVALRRHVNVRVDLRHGEQYMVDIDPVTRSSIASAEILSDAEAAALYHANLSMNALLERDHENAFAQALRALELAPGIDYLWVNLGAIYRRTGQDDAAELVYRAALDINPNSPPAMNNLAVLYNARGDLELSRYWEEKVARHRESNPYYHYHLGETAESAGDLDSALGHYMDAIALKDNDAEFYYRVARIYHALRRPAETIRFIEEAIDRSRLVGERDEYREFLEEVSRASLARLDAGK